MDNSKIVNPDFISLNDIVIMHAMQMVIEGYRTQSGTMIDKALQIMDAFKGAPLFDMKTTEFVKKFGE